MGNKILAVAAGNEITEKDLQRMIVRYPEQQRAYLETEDGKKQLLEQMIANVLMGKFGEEIGIDKEKDYIDTIEALAKDFLAQMTINKVLSEVTVLDEEIVDFYNANKGNFVEEPTVSAKHILVPTEEEATNIKKEIVAGTISFEDAAKAHSTCPSKEEGGSLGEFKRGMMVPEFEEAAFNGEIGVVTEPVQTQFGYHLILVENKSEAKEKELETVREAIKNQLVQQASQKKYQDLVLELSEKYGVERK